VTLSGGTITQTMAVDLPATSVVVAAVIPGIETSGPVVVNVPAANTVVAALAPEVVGSIIVDVPAASAVVAGVVPVIDATPADPTPTLLLHFDGSDGATTFTDSSPNNWTVTTGGNAALTTTSPKFGSAWLSLGTTGFITLPADSGLVIGTSDFTIDFWCKPSRTNGNDGLFTFGGTLQGPIVSIVSGSWNFSNGATAGPAVATATTDLVHIALTRSGSSVRFFIDGVQQGSTQTWTDNFTGTQLGIGYYFSSSFRLVSGFIDEFRFVKGTAVWTANFTPPTAPYS